MNAAHIQRLQPRIDLSQPDNSEYEKGRAFLAIALWHFIGSPIVRSNLIPVSGVKCAILRLFGARIGRGVYAKPGLRVKFPWYLTVGDHCWLGEDAWIDNLAPVTLGDNVCISQAAYLCTGNHDWSLPNMKLFRRPIVLNDGSWVGARATICPGVTLGTGAIAAAGSVIGKDIPAWEIWSGNPARFVRARRLMGQARRASSGYFPETGGETDAPPDRAGILRILWRTAVRWADKPK